jgi:hypothetical protein
MSDEAEKDAPYAPGLDEWHVGNSNSADSDDNKKAAAEFQAHRRWHYYNTGQDVGGFAQPGLGGGREVYRQRGRQNDWR